MAKCSKITNFIAAMPPLCALAGALLIGYPMQRFGRRTALIGLSVPFFLGFILMGFTYLVKHKAILFIGRLMSGLMNGAATPASQIYVRRKQINLKSDKL